MECRNIFLNQVHVFVCFSPHKQTTTTNKARRKPSLASITSYRKRRNTDEESTKKSLAANWELDVHSEKTDEEDEILRRWWLYMWQMWRIKTKKELEMKVKKQQTDHKLKVVTVGYSSGGLMKEEIITFTIMWDLPNY